VISGSKYASGHSRHDCAGRRRAPGHGLVAPELPLLSSPDYRDHKVRLSLVDFIRIAFAITLSGFLLLTVFHACFLMPLNEKFPLASDVDGFGLHQPLFAKGRSTTL